jgi:hypothetical protein
MWHRSREQQCFRSSSASFEARHKHRVHGKVTTFFAALRSHVVRFDDVVVKWAITLSARRRTKASEHIRMIRNCTPLNVAVRLFSATAQRSREVSQIVARHTNVDPANR